VEFIALKILEENIMNRFKRIQQNSQGLDQWDISNTMIWKQATLEDRKLLTRGIWGGMLELVFVMFLLFKGMSKVFRRSLTLKTKALKIQVLFIGKELLSHMLILCRRTGKKMIVYEKLQLSPVFTQELQ